MADAYSIAFKTCIRCKRNQSTSEYYRYLRSKDKLAYECKTCQKERAAAWQKKNPEKKKASDKKQKSRPEVQARDKERKRKVFDANRETEIARLAEWNKKHPERVALRQAKFRKLSPNAVAAIQKRYHDKEEYKYVHRLRSQVLRAVKKAKELGIVDEICINRKQWAQVIEIFEGRCCYCGSESELSIEHLTPLIRGGTNAPGNIAPACLPCNRKKWMKTLEEFIPARAEEIRQKASI